MTPVFIAGCDRSGTTMLGDLLGAHSKAIVTPESHFFHDILVGYETGRFEREKDLASYLLNNFRYSTWALKLSARQLEELIDIRNPAESIRRLVMAYGEQMVPQRSYQYWIDHTPDNAKFFPLLRAHFPNSKFIHIVRDGRAVYASLKGLNWGPNRPLATSIFWYERVLQAIQAEKIAGADSLRIRYEDLVENPRSILAIICNFIGVEFEEQILLGGGLALPAFTRSQHRLVGRAPDSTKAYSWTTKITKSDDEMFRSYDRTAALLKTFGYSSDGTGVRVARSRQIIDLFFDFAIGVFNKYKHFRMERAAVSTFRSRINE